MEENAKGGGGGGFGWRVRRGVDSRELRNYVSGGSYSKDRWLRWWPGFCLRMGGVVKQKPDGGVEHGVYGMEV